MTREADGKKVNGKDVIFDWLAKEVGQRDPQKSRTVVAIMDGETKLRDLQEQKLGRAVGILDIWHVTEYLWKLAHRFHSEGSDEAEAFAETYPRKLLEGKVRRVIGASASWRPNAGCRRSVGRKSSVPGLFLATV